MTFDLPSRPKDFVRIYQIALKQNSQARPFQIYTNSSPLDLLGKHFGFNPRVVLDVEMLAAVATLKVELRLSCNFRSSRCNRYISNH
jgi:hypothetical protein